MKKLSWSAVPLAMLALSGCQSKPEGQVAAKVDGQAITTQALDAELADAPSGVDRLAYRKAVLPQIVDRTLLAQAAQKMGLDKTPEFAAQREREEQKLLIQMLAQKLANTAPVPNVQAVDAYIAAHPYEFAQRQKFYVDQIRFAKPPTTDALLALGRFTTLDALADELTRNATPFTRDHVLIDSAYLDPAVAAQVAKQAFGDPILLPYKDGYTANAIVQRMAAPTTGEPARGLAAEILRRKAIADALGQKLKEERQKASISYEAGFKPAGKPAAVSQAVSDAAGQVSAKSGAPR